MKKVMLKNVKKGDYFTFKPIEEPKMSQVYIREDYCRAFGKYEVSKYTDTCATRLVKGNTFVYIDFFF